MKTLLIAVLALCACKDSSMTTSSTTTATVTASTPATASATAATTTTATATAAVATATGAGLPRAKDILPAGEVSGDSLVVVGDGYRFQVPPVFASTGAGKYTGRVSGMIADTTLTFWVSKEPFAGDTKALVARELDEAKATRATITQAAGPAMMKTAGTMDNAHAQRFVAQFPDRYEMREMTVYKGNAYVFHCATPAVLNAWINVGSDCMIKGTTFHVAPPAST